MSATDIVLVIGSVFGGLISLTGAIFAGWIAIRQNPAHQQTAERVSAQVTAVHAVANGKLQDALDDAARLRVLNDTLTRQLLEATHELAGKPPRT
jgi:hypothetical protein